MYNVFVSYLTKRLLNGFLSLNVLIKNNLLYISQCINKEKIELLLLINFISFFFFIILFFISTENNEDFIGAHYLNNILKSLFYLLLEYGVSKFISYL